jgi:diguanylate cyclase (GGDEF)-like protein
MAERMRRRIENMVVRLPDSSGAVTVTACFGVASLQFRSGETPDSFLKRADDALYEAKDKGRNRVCSSGEKKPRKEPYEQTG